jgi:hypothetical protein
MDAFGERFSNCPLAELKLKEDTTLEVKAPNYKIFMSIPHDGPSELLEKAKDSRRWEDLIAYLDQLEHMLAKMLSN